MKNQTGKSRDFSKYPGIYPGPELNRDPGILGIKPYIKFIIWLCKNIFVYVAFREALTIHMATKGGNVAAVEDILFKASVAQDRDIDINKIVDNSGYTAAYYAFRDRR